MTRSVILAKKMPAILSHSTFVMRGSVVHLRRSGAHGLDLHPLASRIQIGAPDENLDLVGRHLEDAVGGRQHIAAVQEGSPQNWNCVVVVRSATWKGNTSMSASSPLTIAAMVAPAPPDGVAEGPA